MGEAIDNLILKLTRVVVPPYTRMTEQGFINVDGYTYERRWGRKVPGSERPLTPQEAASYNAEPDSGGLPYHNADEALQKTLPGDGPPRKRLDEPKKPFARTDAAINRGFDAVDSVAEGVYGFEKKGGFDKLDSAINKLADKISSLGDKLPLGNG